MLKLAVSLFLVSWLSDQDSTAEASVKRGPDSIPDLIQDAAQDPSADPIRALLVDLEQPGPEGRELRTAAIDGLLGMVETRAAVAAASFVVERARSGDDPDATAVELLDTLDRALRSDHHRAYGRDQRAVRGAMLVEWAPSLFEILSAADIALRRVENSAAGGSVPGEGSGSENRSTGVGEGRVDGGALDGSAVDVVQVPGALGRIADGAARVLRGLDPKTRRDLLRLGLEGDEDFRRDAVRAAGWMRDLGLVRFLGERLANPALATDARVALGRLTFATAEFATPADVEDWLAVYGDLTYVDLAERAVRTARAEIRAQGSSLDRLLADRAGSLVEALAAADPPRWARIRKAFEDENVALAREALRDQLAKTLSKRLSAGDSLGRADADRARFCEFVWARFGDSIASLDPDWLLIAGAVVDPNDTQRVADLRDRLDRALTAGDASVRLAALATQRRFPSGEARARVLDVGRRALVEGEAELLRSAVECLLAPNWTAPTEAAPDRGQWVDLLRSLLVGDGVAEELRQLAVDASVLRDLSGNLVGPVLVPLCELAKSNRFKVSLRVLATARMSVFLGRPELAQTVLSTAAQLARDPDPALRRTLGSQWEAYLRADLDGNVAIDVARQVLTEESDPKIVRVWIEALRAVDEPETLRARLIANLVEAARSIPPTEGARRAVFIEGLRTVTIDPSRPFAEWRLAFDGLLALGSRSAILAAMEQRDLASMLSRAGSDRQDVIDLAFRGAELWPIGELPAPLVQLLLRVDRELSPEERSERPFADRLVLLDATLADNNTEAAQALAQRLASSDQVGASQPILQIQRARIAFARAEDEAGLELLRGTEGVTGPAASDAFHRASLATSDGASLEWARLALGALDDTSPSWWARSLDYWDLRVELGRLPDGAVESLRLLLPRFEGRPEESRFRAILTRAEQSAGDGSGAGSAGG